MVGDRLYECEYCGGLRVYEDTRKCPGCGAPYKMGDPRDAQVVDIMKWLVPDINIIDSSCSACVIYEAGLRRGK